MKIIFLILLLLLLAVAAGLAGAFALLCWTVNRALDREDAAEDDAAGAFGNHRHE